MARDFPDIVNFGSAFRFALQAEQSGADFAAETGIVAPDQEWRDRLEVLVCAHDDRMNKLMALRQDVNEMILEPLDGLDASAYVEVLQAEPASSWPEAAEQLVRVEEAIAGYHEAFVHHAEDVLADQARAFTKAARQARQTAEELDGLLA